MNDIATKLSAARTRLVLDKPFLGALVLHLPLELADPAWCRTMATDARALYFNPEFVDTLSLSQTQFILAHETLHCALGHFTRRGHRVKQRWDRACDYAVNHVLVNEGLQPPPGILLDQQFAGMTAEEIYPLLEEESATGPLDQHLYDSRDDEGRGRGDEGEGGGRTSDSERARQEAGRGPTIPPPLSAQEREALSDRWRQRLAWAAQQTRQAGRLSAALARWIDALLQPQVSWRALLAHYMMSAARDDYSFARPSRREGDFILPRLHSAQLALVVALDTSGSITDEEIREFMSEVDALKGQVRARVTLHGCDARLAAQGPWHYEPWENFTLPKGLEGGGGTRFTPVFEWIARQDSCPDLLLYFTDARGEFPEKPPDYPVIWLVKGKGDVPWGQRIQLN
jgi:predicted metal-dependent peptidase